MASSPPSTSKVRLDSAEPPLLPQYGFGATYAFDDLVQHHHFLYRVHTPKRKDTLSRPSSPRPGSPRPALSRSPSSLSASITSLRNDGPADDDTASSDPYFLSRRFKDDLSSPDWTQRRRTLSTLSNLSGHTYVGGMSTSSEDGDGEGFDSEGETAVSGLGLSRSVSMTLSPTISRLQRHNSSLRPGHKRSQSADQANLALAAGPAPSGNMTYEELVRHMDWTTRSASPYVTTSFSFFWCLWEAVRRYKIGVKHDVEIAVIDARKVHGRAKTALEVLRGVEGGKQDKSYWKWYRFALESQDVLVFGAIPGDAIYASIPLTQILPKLPAYFFKDAIPKSIDSSEEVEADPRSPSSQRPHSPTFPAHSHDNANHSTPSFSESTHVDRAFTPHLLSSLAWDIGTSLRPHRHHKTGSTSSSAQRSPSKAHTHTSHREFCTTLTAAYLAPGRTHAAQLLDATTGAVKLAECLIEPWFRAHCAMGAPYPFRHGDEDDEDSDSDSGSDKENGSRCLGLAGDGCALESSDDSIDPEVDDAKREAAGALTELALSIARWPAGWWYAEHVGEVEGVISEVVGICVGEAGRGVGERVGRSVERERRRVARAESLSGSTRSLGEKDQEERRGREEKREGRLSKAKSPLTSPRPQDGSPKPWPTKGTPTGTPSKPRARSPLGLVEPALGPAIVLKDKSAKDKRRSEDDGDKEASPDPKKNDYFSDTSPAHRPGTPPTSILLANSAPGTHISWSTLTTPPPTPPRGGGGSSSVRSSAGSLNGRRTPPPPPPPRSTRRLSSPSPSFSSFSSSVSPVPSPGASPSASLRLGASPAKPALDRAGSVPGGWPGSNLGSEARNGSAKEGGSSDDAIKAPQPRKRRLSWAGRTLGTLGTFGLGELSFGSFRKKNKSSESLRSRAKKQGEEKEDLLQEAVRTALGANATGTREPTTQVEPAPTPALVPPSQESKIERGRSEHDADRKPELSPVREVAHEIEVEAEAASGHTTIIGAADNHPPQEPQTEAADADSETSISSLVTEDVHEQDAASGHRNSETPPEPIAQPVIEVKADPEPERDLSTNPEPPPQGVTVSEEPDAHLISPFADSEDEALPLPSPATADAPDAAPSPFENLPLTPDPSLLPSAPVHKRSGTLESIPEEEKDEWSAVEHPSVVAPEEQNEALAAGPETGNPEPNSPGVSHYDGENTYDPELPPSDLQAGDPAPADAAGTVREVTGPEDEIVEVALTPEHVILSEPQLQTDVKPHLLDPGLVHYASGDGDDLSGDECNDVFDLDLGLDAPQDVEGRGDECNAFIDLDTEQGPASADALPLDRRASFGTDDGGLQDAVGDLLKPDAFGDKKQSDVVTHEPSAAEEGASAESEAPLVTPVHSDRLRTPGSSSSRSDPPLTPPTSDSASHAPSVSKADSSTHGTGTSMFNLDLPYFLTSRHTSGARSPASPVFEDDPDALARASGWAVSCFVCGVIVTLVLISVQRREVVIANRFT